jgi:hypothetical protein
MCRPRRRVPVFGAYGSWQPVCAGAVTMLNDLFLATGPGLFDPCRAVPSSAQV